MTTTAPNNLPSDSVDAIHRSPATGVTVVIPTFNRSADVQRALANLWVQQGVAVDVIVVDNSSTDGTADMVAQQQQQVWGERLRYLRKAPEGPASARNLGVRQATTPYVLFHDSDVELSPNWVQHAIAYLDQEPRLGAVGGHIVYAFEPSRVNAYGGDLGWFGLAWDVSEGEPLSAQTGAAQRIWINCSAMLVRREAVLAAGAFDESFFYGFEDTDLGWRLRILGYEVRVEPALIAKHHVDAFPGATHPQIVFHYCKNRLRMLLRNSQSWRLLLVLGVYLGYAVVDGVLRAPRRPKWQALFWNIQCWRETWGLRKRLQSQRQVSDQSVWTCGSGRWFPPTRLAGQRRRAVSGSHPSSVGVRGAGGDDRV
ncbi:glycosyltransferase family 2 protein [Ottowia thiooxydans]|mgnify:CR=1 FL=1|uniref:glycosyltransferase family 2 protein n=1 Tax=Ottowia thiooxydans TaxID=219182 RepID=UPI0004248C83|nr:glycosyltransferase family 2 protein [Ottowia thiooxydans]